MAQDRLGSDDLPLTHQFLGIMLCVQRSGVTDALQRLEGVRIIRAARFYIHALDRERLEQTAGDSYSGPDAEFERLVGPMNLRLAEPGGRTLSDLSLARYLY